MLDENAELQTPVHR